MKNIKYFARVTMSLPVVCCMETLRTYGRPSKTQRWEISKELFERLQNLGEKSWNWFIRSLILEREEHAMKDHKHWGFVYSIFSEEEDTDNPGKSILETRKYLCQCKKDTLGPDGKGLDMFYEYPSLWW